VRPSFYLSDQPSPRRGKDGVLGWFTSAQTVEAFTGLRVEAILEPAGNVGPGTVVAYLPVAARQHGIHLALERQGRDSLDLPAKREVALERVGGRDRNLVARLCFEEQPLDDMVRARLSPRVDDLHPAHRLLGRLGVGTAVRIEHHRDLLPRHRRVVRQRRNQELTRVLQVHILDRGELGPSKDDVVAVDDQSLHRYKPSREAERTSSTLAFSPSLLQTLATWVSTVRSPMCSCSPISRAV
jgi:hypothetical protein